MSISEIISGFIQRDTYNANARRLEDESAKTKKRTECLRCGACCWRRPCVPTPKELERIAEYLKLPVKEAVRKFFASDRLWMESTIYILPLKEVQKDLGGKFLPADRTFDEGYCIFFNKESRLCAIWPVRPEDARGFNCWEAPNGDAKIAINSWHGVDVTKYGAENRCE